jgi:hypothetical protein
MSNDVLFYGSLVTFVLVVLGVYRLVVSQKDATIQLLKQRLEEQREKIQLLELQTPDALAKALSERVERLLAEIERLRADSILNRDEIKSREAELGEVQLRLGSLLTTIRNSDFLCPRCGAPLIQRTPYEIHGYVGGREVDAGVEYLEYECGLAINHSGEVSPCKGTPRSA